MLDWGSTSSKPSFFSHLLVSTIPRQISRVLQHELVQENLYKQPGPSLRSPKTRQFHLYVYAWLIEGVHVRELQLQSMSCVLHFILVIYIMLPCYIQYLSLCAIHQLTQSADQQIEKSKRRHQDGSLFIFPAFFCSSKNACATVSESEL